jgi:hypothetical protein
MSLTLHSTRKNWGLPEAAGHGDRKPSASLLPAIFRFIRKAAVKSATFLVRPHEVFAEARMHKAMVEVELYRNRYRHTSKNDDDLPIAESAPAQQVAPSVSPRVALRRAAGAVVSTAKRVFPVIFILAFFAVAVATTIAIRLTIWLPLYWR